jgi:hypothetical protein
MSYDLHLMREHMDRAVVVTLDCDVAVTDAKEFRNQYPAYATDYHW